MADVIHSHDRVGRRYNGQPIVRYRGYEPVYSPWADLLTLAWSVELEGGDTVTVYDYEIVRDHAANTRGSYWQISSVARR